MMDVEWKGGEKTDGLKMRDCGEREERVRRMEKRVNVQVVFERDRSSRRARRVCLRVCALESMREVCVTFAGAVTIACSARECWQGKEYE